MPSNLYLRNKWNSVASSADETVRARILTAIMAQIKQKERLKALFKVSGAAAAACAVLFLGIMLGKNRAASSLDNRPTTWLVADNGAHLLPDNTKVWMNGSSKLSFNEDSFLSDRELWLEGSASFDVAGKKDGRKFMINTPAGAIRVKGTSFTVKQRDSGNISITLYEGDLDFISKDKSLTINLDPSQQLDYNPASRSYKLKTFFSRIAWTDGKYKLDNADLKQVISFIQWKYDTAVILEAGVKDNVQKMTGTIGYNESLESVIDKLCYSLKLEYKKANNAYRLSTK